MNKCDEIAVFEVYQTVPELGTTTWIDHIVAAADYTPSDYLDWVQKYGDDDMKKLLSYGGITLLRIE